MNYNHQPATDIFTYLQLTTLRVGCARSFLRVGSREHGKCACHI